MKRKLFTWASVILAVTLFSILWAIPVGAANPVTLKMQAPSSAGLGSTVTVTTELRDSQGAPVMGAKVILWTPVNFLGTAGSILLGELVTDSDGKAVFSYEPRKEGTIPLNVYFAGNELYDPAQESMELTVSGSIQLYQEVVGVHVPGLGVWVLPTILGIIWFTYFTVIVRLSLIARATSQDFPNEKGLA